MRQPDSSRPVTNVDKMFLRIQSSCELRTYARRKWLHEKSGARADLPYLRVKPKKLRLRLTVGESRDGGTLQIADSQGCRASRGLFFTILGAGWGLLLALNAFPQASGPTAASAGAIMGHVRG